MSRLRRRGLCFVVTVLITFWLAFQSIKWNLWYARHPGFGGLWDKPFSIGCRVPDTSAPRANATLLMLARNSDMDSVIESVKSLELHFNHWFNYPWTFLSDEPFSDAFKDAVRSTVSSKVEFGTIASEHWEFPEDTDEKLVQEALLRQDNRAIKYGGKKSYHQMCRFYSGFFFKNPLVAKYEWYWRVEPDVAYYCDVTYDVFKEMERHGKKYGFNVFMRENQNTVESLFRHTQAFRRRWNVPELDLWKAVTSCILDIGEAAKENPVEPMDNDVYNMCHFWSNFEIARVDLWNSPLYMEYFKELDAAGGFWNERWGDAPVHTHYFRDIGYSHGGLGSCPGNAPGRQIALKRQGAPDPERVNGVGCRCRCMSDHRDYALERDPCLLEGLLPVLGGGSHLYNDYD